MSREEWVAEQMKAYPKDEYLDDELARRRRGLEQDFDAREEYRAALRDMSDLLTNGCVQPELFTTALHGLLLAHGNWLANRWVRHLDLSEEA